jgi:uncharacterized NAD(P)/FAD-binding protein YdhS
MSADPDEPLSFLRFLNKSAPAIKAEDFVSRSLYGDYLEELLRSAEAHVPSTARLLRLSGVACALEPAQRGPGYRIELADGRYFSADTVVLACGNPPPAPLPFFERVREHAGCLSDPWRAAAAFRPNETVLVVGTGLTMVDVVIAGFERTANLTVHALSRHGLLALPQAHVEQAPLDWQGRQALLTAGNSTRRLFHAVRELAREVGRRGRDWREVVTSVRSLAPDLWQRLPAPERRRFLRHVRSWWDIHRNRLPPQSHGALRRFQEQGRLKIHAGHILDLVPFHDRIKVIFRARGGSQPSTLLVDRVVNCTGPDHDLRRSTDPLMRSLLTQGLATADPLGLGIRTSATKQLIGSRGQPSAQLFYLGPLLRGTHWEASAVQELREHAVDLAAQLAVANAARASSM